MARPDEEGIKWWWYCQVCQWAANVNNADNDNTQCPNCNNPNMTARLDDHVFQGRRYDLPVRSSHGQATADAARAAAGRPPAPLDTVNTQNNGHNYGSGPKPFPP